MKLELNPFEVLVVFRCDTQDCIKMGNNVVNVPQGSTVICQEWEEPLAGFIGIDHNNYKMSWGEAKGNFVIFKVDKKEGYKELGDCVKFKKGLVIYSGNSFRKASRLMRNHYPNFPMHGAVQSTIKKRRYQHAGANSVQTGQTEAIQIAGYKSDQSAWNYAIQKAGDNTSQTADENAYQSGGDNMQQFAEEEAVQIAKNMTKQTADRKSLQKAEFSARQIAKGKSVQIAKGYSSQKGKNNMLQKGEELCNQYAEDWAVQIAKNYAVQKAGNNSHQIAGHNAEQHAFCYCHQKAGHNSIQYAEAHAVQVAGEGSLQCSGFNSVIIVHNGIKRVNLVKTDEFSIINVFGAGEAKRYSMSTDARIGILYAFYDGALRKQYHWNNQYGDNFEIWETAVYIASPDLKPIAEIEAVKERYIQNQYAAYKHFVSEKIGFRGFSYALRLKNYKGEIFSDKEIKASIISLFECARKYPSRVFIFPEIGMSSAKEYDKEKMIAHFKNAPANVVTPRIWQLF